MKTVHQPSEKPRVSSLDLKNLFSGSSELEYQNINLILKTYYHLKKLSKIIAEAKLDRESSEGRTSETALKASRRKKEKSRRCSRCCNRDVPEAHGEDFWEKAVPCSLWERPILDPGETWGGSMAKELWGTDHSLHSPAPFEEREKQKCQGWRRELV